MNFNECEWIQWTKIGFAGRIQGKLAGVYLCMPILMNIGEQSAIHLGSLEPILVKSLCPKIGDAEPQVMAYLETFKPGEFG